MMLELGSGSENPLIQRYVLFEYSVNRVRSAPNSKAVLRTVRQTNLILPLAVLIGMVHERGG